MSFRVTNWIYSVGSMAMLVIVPAKLWLRPLSVSLFQRRVLWVSWFMVLAPIAFLIYISIAFDFHNCPYPSRAFPYMPSGRLAMSMLVPFMLVFVSGLDQLLERFPERAKFTILSGLLLLMVTLETITNWKAFADPYNWFHV